MWKNKLSAGLLALVLLLVLTACSPKSPDSLTFLDGRVKVLLPPGWAEMKGQLNTAADLEMGHERRAAFCTILSEDATALPPEFSFAEFSNTTRTAFLASLEQPAQHGPLNSDLLQLENVHYELSATVGDSPITYWHLCVNTGSHYHQIFLWSLKSHFADNQPEFEAILQSFSLID